MREIFALLGCYVAQIGGWPLKMEPKGCPETSVTTNLRNVTSQKSEELILFLI
jgi:hypothetical protein